MKNYCNFHSNYRNAWRESRDPREDCCRCQSIKDSEHSCKVWKSHVPGKWCKDHNHCGTCSEIKHLVRVLKHYGGTCSPKKCPVCEWDRDPQQRHNVSFHASERVRLNMITRLYKLLLGIKPGKYWKYY